MKGVAGIAAGLLGLLAATLPAAAAVQVPGCSLEQAIRAEIGSDDLKSWTDLYRAFQEFRACDDGSVAEGWDDFTERMLTEHWNELPELQRLVKRDPRFGPFVLRHLSEMIAGDDHVKAIRQNAKNRCPIGSRTLCQGILKALQ
jgi:hypothetical protein